MTGMEGCAQRLQRVPVIKNISFAQIDGDGREGATEPQQCDRGGLKTTVTVTESARRRDSAVVRSLVTLLHLVGTIKISYNEGFKRDESN